MGKLLKGKGKVLLLRYQEGSASTEAREKGFLEALKAAIPGIDGRLVRPVRRARRATPPSASPRTC